ncbi:MAG: hypothetical protein KJZ64_08475 [Sphingomonadaceae bacterium]|nr:hypothetical protein [Sphingomonadaceae bacterium]
MTATAGPTTGTLKARGAALADAGNPRPKPITTMAVDKAFMNFIARPLSNEIFLTSSKKRRSKIPENSNHLGFTCDIPGAAGVNWIIFMMFAHQPENAVPLR